MTIIGGYQRFADKIGFSCVFRGQTRDYFNAVEVLLVLPGILRVNRLYQSTSATVADFAICLIRGSVY
jgi:hypothetical protein